MDDKDFIRTESYSQRLKTSGAKKLTEEFNKWMNNKITYRGKPIIWSYVLLLKNRELAQYLVEKRKTIDFSKPYYAVERQDSEDVRQKILSISYTDWKKRGFSEGTLYYMKENAKSLPKNKVVNFIWCNKSVDCDTWRSMYHNFDSLFFGEP